MFDQNIIYITECGCRLDKSELKRRRFTEDGITYDIYVCKNHLGRMVKTESFCIDCGILLELDIKAGPINKRCVKCSVQRNLDGVNNRSRNKRLAELKGAKYPKKIKKINDELEAKKKLHKSYQNEHLSDLSRTNCKFYLTRCLTKYYKYNAVPCRCCRHYVIQHGNVDPLYSRTGGGGYDTGKIDYGSYEDAKIRKNAIMQPLAKTRGTDAEWKKKHDRECELKGRELRRKWGIKAPAHWWRISDSYSGLEGSV